MFGMTMLGSAWRSAFLITSVMKKESSSGVGSAVGGFLYAVKSLVSSVFVVAMRQPLLYSISSIAAFIFSLCTVLILYGICFCSNPSLISTWASRRNEAKFCVQEETCHVYATLGINSTRLRIVGHFQSSDAAPTAYSVQACEADRTSKDCRGPTWFLRTVLLDLADVSEDLRYVVHGLATNLSGSTAYQFKVSFTSAKGPTTTRSITIVTVPDAASEETFTFLGGGDYHSSTLGIEVLAAGVAAVSNPRFLMLGGDLSYANNLRTCYLRWDRFLHAMSTLVTAEGFHLPMLTIPGNHESGGYLVEPSRSLYYFYTQYLPQYDDDWPRDPTITYHSHVAGKRFGIIALDSNLMIPVDGEQTEYLRRNVVSMRGIDAADLSTTLTTGIIDRMRFVAVMYHNPAYPVLDSFDDSSPIDPTPLILRWWTPIFDQQKVPLALEFHEHVYKRTKPMTKGAVVASDGVVYLGDGALGVFKGRKISPTDFSALSAPSNYINTFTVFGQNGSVAFQSVFVDGDGVGTLGDSLMVARRL